MTLLSGLNPLAFRRRWRDLQHRVNVLERRLGETDAIMEILLADSEYQPREDVGMNGQRGRKAVVRDLFDRLNFAMAVETGTYLGASTGYIATEFQVPVFSSELVAKYHLAAKRRLMSLPNVSLRHCDGRALLRELAADSTVTAKPTFFYLDAHWYEDLPLAEEVEIIAGAWLNFAVLIDDFRVPGDSGYKFDDYGSGKTLDLSYLRPLLESANLTPYFPILRSCDETGNRRGYVVLAPSAMASQMATLSSLRVFDPDASAASTVGR